MRLPEGLQLHFPSMNVGCMLRAESASELCGTWRQNPWKKDSGADSKGENVKRPILRRNAATLGATTTIGRCGQQQFLELSRWIRRRAPSR